MIKVINLLLCVFCSNGKKNRYETLNSTCTKISTPEIIHLNEG